MFARPCVCSSRRRSFPIVYSNRHSSRASLTCEDRLEEGEVLLDLKFLRLRLSSPRRVTGTAGSVIPHAALLILAAIFLSVAGRQPISLYDEGLAILGAARVLDGDVPYRDFWALYPPGVFYTLAGVFRVFGASIAAERVYDAIIRLGLVLVSYAIARRVTSPLAAFSASSFVLLFLAVAGAPGYAILPAVLLGLLSVLALLQFAVYKRAYWLVVAGLLVGATAVFRLDVGAYAAVAQGVGIPLLSLDGSGTSDRQIGGQGLVRLAIHRGVIFIGGVAISFLPPLVFLLTIVPPGEIWQDLVVFPLTRFHAVRSLPLPALYPDPIPVIAGSLPLTAFGHFVLRVWLPFYLPLLVLAVVVVAAATRFRRPDTLESRRKLWTQVVLAIFGACLFLQAISRTDMIHLMPATILAIILGWSLVSDIVLTPRILRPVISPGRVLLLGAVIVATLLPMPLRAGSSYVKGFVNWAHWPSLPRAGFVYVEPDQARAVQFVQGRVPAGQPIFVGNVRHDRIVENDVSFYFLADRPAATKYHELHPGVATTLPIQQAIVLEMRSAGVRCVVLYAGFEDRPEPNESAVSSGIHLLDQFIRSEYQTVQQFGAYEILEARDEAHLNTASPGPS